MLRRLLLLVLVSWAIGCGPVQSVDPLVGTCDGKCEPPPFPKVVFWGNSYTYWKDATQGVNIDLAAAFKTLDRRFSLLRLLAPREPKNLGRPGDSFSRFRPADDKARGETYQADSDAYTAQKQKVFDEVKAELGKDFFDAPPAYPAADQLLVMHTYLATKWAAFGMKNLYRYQKLADYASSKAAAVLQGHSTEPIDSREKFVAGGVELARPVCAAGGKVILLASWPRRPSYAGYQAAADSDDAILDGSGNVVSSFERMNAELQAGYSALKRAIRAKFSRCDVAIAQVGQAFAKVKAGPCATDTAIDDLYLDDDSHPSAAGQALAAAVIYKTITGDPASAATRWNACLP
ncbi:MAG: hypothetical protein H6707_02380 [Deltaproteobacteria bacterium]|nr:hypothetical protein [Deltaproteobacteria bacterium]